ncbi:MAG: hypothetical protein KDI07_07940, partial [Anaerolineae bacterium]|nr:hypothetical protein [Anaerolineae bacterium]
VRVWSWSEQLLDSHCHQEMQLRRKKRAMCDLAALSWRKLSGCKLKLLNLIDVEVLPHLP